MRKTGRKFFIFAAVFSLLLALLPGCGSGKEQIPGTGSVPGLTRQDTGEDMVAGNDLRQPVGEAAQPSTGTIRVVLYFGDKNGYLAAEQRTIPRTAAIARATLQELVKGPSAGSGLLPTLPAGTTLRDIKIQDGLATVDFSKELKSGHKGGSAGETVAVYSIVNTLSQFPTVQKVQILIDGQKVETLAGHMDLSSPLERSSSILRKNSGTF